jgi:FAD/FMN-containing dehydrogenase
VPDVAPLDRLLAGCLAPRHWTVEPAVRARFACDAFDEGDAPAGVVTPGSADELARALPRLVEAGYAIVPCGGSLSYSAGTLPAAGPWVAIDTRGVSRVLEVNAVDRTVRVEAGATWAALDAELASRALRCPFWGPASGLHATLGGTIANDGIFFGSAAFGTARHGVLGLTALLADGSRLETGVHLGRGGTGQSLALPLGPDLGALFVGSCGAFGIIVEVTLPLIERPSEVLGAGFGCADASVATAALAALARDRVVSEAIAVAPRGADGPWSLSLAVESTCADDARARLARASDACRSAGAAPSGDGMLRAFRASPFLPPTMLRDAAGRRWVPIHGLLPHSRALQGAQSVERVMWQQASRVAESGITHSLTLALVGPGAVLVEANLYWPDSGNALLDDYLGAGARRPGPASRLTPVRVVREQLVAALDAIGATHLQIGRLYPWLERLDPAARKFAMGAKRLLDPRGAMNPGVLGLPAGKAAG